jgi:hypothetical protein
MLRFVAVPLGLELDLTAILGGIRSVLEFVNYLWGLGTVRIVLSYRPAWLHKLAELIPWHRFLGSLKL